ncbi:MAG: hypothetical protein NDF54_10500 [archaeon GB-1867-035]|nr:hypothetical protein [Candidatus Culexmicrobium profundum]
MTWSIAIKGMRYLKDEIELLRYFSDNNLNVQLLSLVAINAAKHSTLTATILLHFYENDGNLKIYTLSAALLNLEVYFDSLANNLISRGTVSLEEMMESY